MKRTLSFYILLLCFVAGADAQSIKMSLSGVTAAGGELVLAVEHKISNTASSGGGGGSTAGVTNFGNFKVKKANGASTNELFKRTVNGTHTAQISFDYYDNTGTLFYSIVLKDVIFTGFDYLTPECSGCAKIYHQLTIDYNQIEITDVAAGSTLKYNRSTRVFY